MITGINHLAIATGDIDRLSKFYVAIGFEFVWEGVLKDNPDIDSVFGLPGTDARVMKLRAGNLYLELFEFSAPQSSRKAGLTQPNDQGYTHMCFEVTDIDAEWERLTRAGMTFHRKPAEFMGGHLRAVYGRDPDGNIVELAEILSKERPQRLADLPRMSGPAAS